MRCVWLRMAGLPVAWLRMTWLALLAGVAGAAAGCLSADETPTPAAVIDEVWTLVDTRYALFGDKPDLDWDGARERALDALGDAPSDTRLFDVIAGMLTELDDQHTNLRAPFDVSGQLIRTLDAPRLYEADRVERRLFGALARRAGSLLYGALSPAGEAISVDAVAAAGMSSDDIAYLRLDDFDGIPADDILDAIIAGFDGAAGLILDLRSNGGGSLEAMFRFAGRLHDPAAGARAGLSYQFTDGPARDALTAPSRRDFEAVAPGFVGPIAVLIDGHSYSAANALCFLLRERATLIGQPTGGGGGLPAWVELSNGWQLRLSTGRLTDADGAPLEPGLRPDVMADLMGDGIDPMLDAAVQTLLNP